MVYIFEEFSLLMKIAYLMDKILSRDKYLPEAIRYYPGVSPPFFWNEEGWTYFHSLISGISDRVSL